jgi:hypothetical protein
VRLVAAATLLAALGLVAHNLLSLPLSPLAAETVGPLAVYAALLAWLVLARGAAVRLAPLPFLPFVPEQTAEHYVAHLIYTVTQVPLIGAISTMPRIAWRNGLTKTGADR